ncbi:MAG: hypothetical protein GKC04_01305 [Methanomicrobiales archaeon]|nr:hypothetical protein [Methanomicrobiales archaeon]
MRDYKHIEACIARYIVKRYRNVVEIGVGKNFAVAETLVQAGCAVRCTDIRPADHGTIAVLCDDICNPRPVLYAGAELLYAVRPGVEMVPFLIALARDVGADCLVYHLGGEIYENGGRIVDAGVVLHCYHRSGRTAPSEPVKKG